MKFHIGKLLVLLFFYLAACDQTNFPKVEEDVSTLTGFQRRFEHLLGSYACDIRSRQHEWEYDEQGEYQSYEKIYWIRDTLISVSFYEEEEEFTDSLVAIGFYPFLLDSNQMEESSFSDSIQQLSNFPFIAFEEGFRFKPFLTNCDGFHFGRAQFFPERDSLWYYLAADRTRRCVVTWECSCDKVP